MRGQLLEDDVRQGKLMQLVALSENGAPASCRIWYCVAWHLTGCPSCRGGTGDR